MHASVGPRLKAFQFPESFYIAVYRLLKVAARHSQSHDGSNDPSYYLDHKTPVLVIVIMQPMLSPI